MQPVHENTCALPPLRCRPAAQGAQATLAFAMAGVYSTKCVPATQVVQTDCPAFGWNCPSAHAAHASRSGDEGTEVSECALPFAHSRQVAAPRSGWNLPAGHAPHCILPSSAWNCPAAQSAHAVFTGAVACLGVRERPAVQAMHVEAPGCGWYCPDPQLWHASSSMALALMFSSRKRPETHLMHASFSSSGWYCPAEHAVHTPPATGSYLPGGQTTQATPSAAKGFAGSRNLPAAHLMQASLPMMSWYCPMGHAVHGVTPPGAVLCEPAAHGNWTALTKPPVATVVPPRESGAPSFPTTVAEPSACAAMPKP